MSEIYEGNSITINNINKSKAKIKIEVEVIKRQHKERICLMK